MSECVQETQRRLTVELYDNVRVNFIYLFMFELVSLTLSYKLIYCDLDYIVLLHHILI